MPTYLRNLFGGHKRSSSQGPAPAYAATPTAAAASGSFGDASKMQRSYSHTAPRSAAPSPLRYSTEAPKDTRSAYGYGRRPSAAQPRPEMRAHTPRRSSFRTPETPRTQLYTPSLNYATPASSRSNSSSSLYPGMAPGVPRSSSSDAGHYGHSPRPPLRQNHTWNGPGTAGSSSSYGSRGRSSSQSSIYQQARGTTLHMHPLLAHTRLHRAPITYDVLFTPSARTVVDRATHSAIPSHTLSQPATDPPTSAGHKLILRSHKFPWPVVVTASASSAAAASAPSPSPRRPRFTVGPPEVRERSRSTSTGSAASASAGALSNLDVLYAVHTTLMTPITPEEWESLGHGSKEQQRVTRAYERRCTRMGGGWEGGVRRVDWLGEKTQLIGVEVDKSGGNGGAGKLVFGRA